MTSSRMTRRPATSNAPRALAEPRRYFMYRPTINRGSLDISTDTGIPYANLRQKVMGSGPASPFTSTSLLSHRCILEDDADSNIPTKRHNTCPNSSQLLGNRSSQRRFACRWIKVLPRGELLLNLNLNGDILQCVKPRALQTFAGFLPKNLKASPALLAWRSIKSSK